MQSLLSGIALLQICVRCTTSTLEKLSHTALWLDIREFADSNHFWFLRLQARRREPLHWRPEISWRDVERTIHYMHSRTVISDRCASVSELVERFCLETHIPDDKKEFSILQCCCLAGASSLVQDVLRSDLSVESRWLLTHILGSICSRGHVDVVRVLLEDGRVDPVPGGFACLRDACMAHETGVVNLLVRDRRYDWNSHKSLVIQLAHLMRDRELLEVLAEKEWIAWHVRPLWVVTAILALLVCF